MFIDFSLVALDQVHNQIAKTHYMSGGRVKVPLTMMTQGGGYKGAAAQHSQMLEALFLQVPGIKVVCPSNPADAKGLIAAAIQDDNPVLFIEHKQLLMVKGEVPEGEHFVPLGKANVIQEGSDISIFTYSYTVTLVEQALKDSGISADVIDLRTLNPLDWDTIAASVKKTHRAIIVHESHMRCGVGVDLAAQIQEKLFDELDAPVTVCAAADTPIPFAKSLEDVVLPTPERIRAAIEKVLHG
jgi:pyruvate dehydrogenase E1 component beta subunit